MVTPVWTGVAVVVAAAVAGCGGTRTEPAGPVRDERITADRELIEIASLEADRGFSRHRLIELVDHASTEVRIVALRALGRVGDAGSIDVVAQTLAEDDPAIRAAAARALGLAAATTVEQEVIGAYRDTEDAAARATIARALGRLGGAASVAVLTAALGDDDPSVAAAGGIALGRLGRREIALDDAARAALVEASSSGDRDVRYAATYGLAREHVASAAGDEGGGAADVATTALVARLVDDDAEIAATAVAGLARRGAAPELLMRALEHEDWRVRVEAVRGVATERASERERALLAVRMAREWTVLGRSRAGPGMHVVTEGLRRLADFASEEAVRTTARVLHDSAAKVLAGDVPASARLSASTLHCLTAAILARSGTMPLGTLESCGGDEDAGMPVHARRGILAETLAAGYRQGAGDVAADARLRELARLVRDGDPRVRAAAVGVVPRLVDGSPPALATSMESLLATALEDGAASVAGTAVDVVAQLVEAGHPVGAAVAARVPDVVRDSGADAELAITALDAITRAKIDGGLPLCTRLHGNPNRAVRAAARACLEALTGDDPGAGRADAPPARPPVNPGQVLGKRVTWTVTTTKGDVVIELAPDRAPWHVAVITKLVDDGLYDDTLWHRVVPDFVVQGGDPAGSGWGGPGFVVPGEPSSARFDRGAVGIADAGLDTGGSQWFVMHTRAPHLEGRYTHIGRVVRGQDVIDALLVGDRIVSTRLEIVAPPDAE